ncbi:hypothetical protein PPERSA_05951 [Pseudocohnilembus persalinus]|uniref:Transmembrane protein n=1 Tax=Pseudocohnilembus persalinus TaxID=266149 RepID=A0A0V0R471_PSEPJ|nr:hypothetical protein PPERSA_05951 [Pseudocohnilembus persalinus]|eukprot:KRX09282.1 hypothetical protein PPERSA_05951 [Pseudocohnilembus persalinus]
MDDQNDIINQSNNFRMSDLNRISITPSFILYILFSLSQIMAPVYGIILSFKKQQCNLLMGPQLVTGALLQSLLLIYGLLFGVQELALPLFLGIMLIFLWVYHFKAGTYALLQNFKKNEETAQQLNEQKNERQNKQEIKEKKDQ